MLIQISILVCLGLQLTIAQRVAPGVPPQQYNAPVHQPPVGAPNPQYQQQQQQYGQVPQQAQYQQPPQYQQQGVPQQQTGHVPQQHVPQQHVPQQHGGGHGHAHGGQPQVLNANIQMEKEHIAEHLDVPMDTSKMSEQELQFHYFKMHDADNNNKLDGCELTKSLIHWHEQGAKDPNNPHGAEGKLFKDDELTNLIDPIMKMDDLNNDGYIDYPEFIRAQQKISENAAQNAQNTNNV